MQAPSNARILFHEIKPRTVAQYNDWIPFPEPQKTRFPS